MNRCSHSTSTLWIGARFRAVAAFILLAVAAACGSEPAPPPAPAAPVPKTAEERTKWYQDCWARFNEKAWDAFTQCYTEDATSETIDSTTPMSRGRATIIENAKKEAIPFPDRRGEVRLVLGHGPHVVSVALWTATHDGPMPSPDGKTIPPTHKKVGLLMAHMAELDATGSRAVRDAAYVEEGTLMAQLGLSKAPARPVMAPTGAPAQVFVARNDDTEARNVAVMQASFDAFAKRDLKTMQSLFADNYTGIEIGRPADMDRKAALAATKELFAGFPDVKLTPASLWGVQDYVVVLGTFEGTNTGNMPSMGLKKTGKKATNRFLEIAKLENGRIKDDWLFYNGASFAAQLGVK